MSFISLAALSMEPRDGAQFQATVQAMDKVGGTIEDLKYTRLLGRLLGNG